MEADVEAKTPHEIETPNSVEPIDRASSSQVLLNPEAMMNQLVDYRLQQKEKGRDHDTRGPL